MFGKAQTAILIALILAITYAIINRYEIQPINGAVGYFMLDRWTGETCTIGVSGGQTLYRCFDRSQRSRAQISN